MQSNNGWQTEAACKDRCVGYGSTQACHKSRHIPAAQHDRVGRGQVTGHNDLLRQTATQCCEVRWLLALAVCQLVHDSPHDLGNIIFLAAQVGVGDLLEKIDQRVGVTFQCPFSILLLFLYGLYRLLGNYRVVQHEKVHIDKCAGFRWCIGR